MSSLWSSLWSYCCPGDIGHADLQVQVPTGNNRHNPATRALSPCDDLLRVAVWNAAGFDPTVAKTFEHQKAEAEKRPHFRLENCRKANDAAKYFWENRFDVVIVPECDDAHKQPFGDKYNAQKAFHDVGFRKVTANAAVKEANVVDGKTCIFYNPNKLDASERNSGPEWGDKSCMQGGKRSHAGKIVGKAFRMNNKTKDWVLITGVHAGHYGKDTTLVDKLRKGQKDANRDQAMKDVEELRKFQNSFIHFWGEEDSTGWSKIIVAGDFNELGNLISENPKKFCPLPKDFQVRGTDNIGPTLSDHGKYDHIWWATHHPRMQLKCGRNPDIHIGDSFGSDHRCVMAENI